MSTFRKILRGIGNGLLAFGATVSAGIGFAVAITILVRSEFPLWLRLFIGIVALIMIALGILTETKGDAEDSE